MPKYIGLNRFDSKITVKSGGAEITGSFSVEGAIKEKGKSIPTLIEKPINLGAGDKLETQASANGDIEAFASILEIT